MKKERFAAMIAAIATLMLCVLLVLFIIQVKKELPELKEQVIKFSHLNETGEEDKAEEEETIDEWIGFYPLIEEGAGHTINRFQFLH